MQIPTYYKGAGILFSAPDSSGTPKVLLGLRNFRPYADHWAIPGGAMELPDDGDFRRTAVRECFEETINLPGLESIRQLLQQRVREAPTHRIHVPFCFDYRVFLVHLSQIPDLRIWPCRDVWPQEFSQFRWFETTELPQPLHPGLGRAIRQFGLKRAIPASPTAG